VRERAWLDARWRVAGVRQGLRAQRSVSDWLGRRIRELREGSLFNVIDFDFVSLVKNPLFNPFGAKQTGLA
jgi:hypothetical protein